MKFPPPHQTHPAFLRGHIALAWPILSCKRGSCERGVRGVIHGWSTLEYGSCLRAGY